MCLYPKLIKNRKYEKTRKNGYNAPELTDERIKYVAVGCGNCIECRKRKAREWSVRLMEELRTAKYAYFVTLTYSEESMKMLAEEAGDDVHKINTLAIRRFVERFRKINKIQIRHWIIEELGQTATERTHLHGVLFPPFPLSNEELFKYWKYGRCDTGEYCNERTINYIIKYVTKIDEKHKSFKPHIFCSRGIGKEFIKTNKDFYKFKNKDTREYYRFPNGTRVNLPTYYRNHFFTEKEREELWKQKIDEHKLYIMGTEYDISTPENEEIAYQARKGAQEYNKALGYGDDSAIWKKSNYRALLHLLNINKL